MDGRRHRARYTETHSADTAAMTKKLADSLTKALQIFRNGDFAELRFKQTSAVVLTLDLFRKLQWAGGRESSGSPDNDRRRFLEQFETIVGLNGSGITTRGSEQALMKLLTALKNAGVPIEQYAIDPRYLELLYPKRELVQALTPQAADTPPEGTRSGG